MVSVQPYIANTFQTAISTGFHGGESSEQTCIIIAN